MEQDSEDSASQNVQQYAKCKTRSLQGKRTSSKGDGKNDCQRDNGTSFVHGWAVNVVRAIGPQHGWCTVCRGCCYGVVEDEDSEVSEDGFHGRKHLLRRWGKISSL